MNDTWSDGPDPIGGDAFDDGTGLDDTGYDDPAGYGDDALGHDTDLDDEPDDTDQPDDPGLDDTVDDVDVDLVVDDTVDDSEPDEVAVFDVVDDDAVGTDPDAPAGGDDDAFTPQFPPDLAVDELPDPVDGPPWTDADLLGDGPDHADTSWNSIDSSATMTDLFTMDGTSGDDWQSLINSDDPAVSSLARWWQP